jgi:hypothetical protein
LIVVAKNSSAQMTQRYLPTRAVSPLAYSIAAPVAVAADCSSVTVAIIFSSSAGRFSSWCE